MVTINAVAVAVAMVTINAVAVAMVTINAVATKNKTLSKQLTKILLFLVSCVYCHGVPATAFF